MKTYRLKYTNQTLYSYCDNLRHEASLIAREIERLDTKRLTIIDLSHRLENDFIEIAEEK
jgi:hypothetical protein